MFSAEQSGVRRPEPSKPELVAMLLAAEYMNAECELFRRLSHGWNFLGNAVTTHNVISHKGDRERFRLKDNRQI
ncbi:MAG: hypothetical protein LBH06_10050 [Rikenellaceae bacterium]|nr:hypothetical protein [Rikenellaceae bacterium]